MRTVLITLLLASAALPLWSCSRSQTAEAASPPPQPLRMDPGAVDGQTLDQVLDRTMNRFARVDLNGDGKLTADELNVAGSGDLSDLAGLRPRQGYSARAFSGDDVNGDGVVTRQEVEDTTRARFKRLDTNGDGKLSTQELAADRAPPPSLAAR